MFGHFLEARMFTSGYFEIAFELSFQHVQDARCMAVWLGVFSFARVTFDLQEIAETQPIPAR